ncbi:MAG: hypothetical protein LBE12_11885 [Planctomycetaceae bacterium]|nr:hypothetical protein [Planctomycetaceae bacterium]
MYLIRNFFFVTIIVCAIIALPNFAAAQKNSESSKLESQKLEPKVRRIVGINAKFIVALISDGEGGAWIGTEDEGVFHYDTNNKITRYTVKDGLGDNNGYALAIDLNGRLWVGHLNMGVSVFNGEKWKNYDVVDGPIGERIFDIKICPKDDDVWMATSAGISRYKINRLTWEHFTREDGLLEDQVSALAFKEDGTLIVGTQCHGIAIFNRSEKGEYKHSQNIVAPERFGPDNCSYVPLTPFGNILPSNQINDIIVTKNTNSKSIWVATSSGLVKMSNDFSKLEYRRGKDFANKVNGLYGGTPKEFKQPLPTLFSRLLPEDYLTTIAEDEVGQIWIGTRQNGVEVMDSILAKRGFVTNKNSGLTDNFVTKILPLKDNNFLIATYGGGVVESTAPFNMTGRNAPKQIAAAEQYAVKKSNFLNLPKSAIAPSIDELISMQKQLSKLTKPLPKQYAAYYSEDWKTQGDWLGRTTKNWAIMCAAVSPFDREILLTAQYYHANSFIGPNATHDDTIRRWVHWIRTDNPKVLWEPFNGYRRQAEWDDHGEAYPLTKDGPDVWYLLEIKHDGMFRHGLYFYNKDGHSGHNRKRDYIIEIYPAKEGMKGNPYDTWKQYSKDAEKTSRTGPLLAKSRVRDFWGGVYKQFLLPRGFYYVKIRRNYSYNTIVSAVIVERLMGKPTHDESLVIPFVSMYLPKGNRYGNIPPAFPNNLDTSETWRIISFWNKLDYTYDKVGGMAIQRKRRIAICQTANEMLKHDEKIKPIVESLKWQLNQWDDEQRKEWLEAMKTAFKNFYDDDPDLRQTIEYQKYGSPFEDMAD